MRVETALGTALGVAVLLTGAGLVGVDGRSTGYVVAFLVAAVTAAAYAALISGRAVGRTRGRGGSPVADGRLAP